jgi:hypothetical protein
MTMAYCWPGRTLRICASSADWRMGACEPCHAYRYRYRRTAKRTRQDTCILIEWTEVLIRPTTWHPIQPQLCHPTQHFAPQSSHDHRAASFDFRIVPRLYTTGLLFFPLPWTWTCTYLYAVRHGACVQRYSSHRHNTVINYVSSYLHHDESQTTGKPSGTLKNYHAPRPTWTISPENSSIFRACDKSPDVSHVVHLAWHLWTWCSPLAVVCSTNTHLSTC